MEDYDDDDSTRSPDPSDGRITVTLAAAATADPINSDHLALSLPGHNTKPSSGGGGVAREDCWSEAATSILIDAWGERYLGLSRGNLKQKHWKEVADIVSSSREMYGKTPKTDMQCKNRIDTVKKKYKLEKSKMMASSSSSASPPSRWPFFHKLEYLIGPAKTPTPLAIVPPASNAKRIPTHPNLHNTLRKQHSVPQNSDSSETEPPDSPDSTDTYPPKPAKKQRLNHPISTATSHPKGKKNDNNGLGASSSIGDLTKAILNLAQVYEQTENAKLRQVMEMEKHRMKFTKELELQRMQLFMKTQMEITQMKESAMRDCGNTHLQHQLHRNEINHASNHIDNHTSDST